MRHPRRVMRTVDPSSFLRSGPRQHLRECIGVVPHARNERGAPPPCLAPRRDDGSLDTASLRACRRLVELDGISIGIFNLDLFSPRAYLDFISDPRAAQFQLL